MSDSLLWWNLLNQQNIQPPQKNLAVLIDTENSSPFKIVEILNEISRLGKASVKRAYGDWTRQIMTSWKQVVVKYSIQPIQQFSYTAGKNSTDSTLIIDAMDILYQNNVDGFCIVSSDSDYTKLAVRLRESGFIVYGFGEKKTPESFSQACDKFIYIENLTLGEFDFKRMQDLLKDTDLVQLLEKAVADASDESGWALLPRVGQIIQNIKPDFDHRSYGFKNLSDLIKNMGIFQIEERRVSDSPTPQVYIRRAELP